MLTRTELVPMAKLVLVESRCSHSALVGNIKRQSARERQEEQIKRQFAGHRPAP